MGKQLPFSDIVLQAVKKETLSDYHSDPVLQQDVRSAYPPFSTGR